MGGTARMCMDSDCSDTEYLKELAVGGAIGAGVGAAIQGASVAAQIGAQVGAGAAMYGSGHMISDASDMLISKTKDEVLSAQNAAGFVAGCALGPFLGPVAQAPPPEVMLVSKDVTQSTCKDASADRGEEAFKSSQDAPWERQVSPRHVEAH